LPESPDSRTLVKICGLTRVEDARHAAAAGADYLGAILSQGFSRSVPSETARDFAEPADVPLVAVFMDEDPVGAARLAREAGAAVLQLHGDEAPEVLQALREEGEWDLWKALRPRTADELREGLGRYAGRVDAFLLDGWHPASRGGSGTRVSWNLVDAVREEVPDGVTLVLAGGLLPENVAGAIARLEPHVVDVSSGVEAAVGCKDPARVERFIRAAHGAMAGREVS
jgi:phosphoribosylanthranilate isomerase